MEIHPTILLADLQLQLPFSSYYRRGEHWQRSTTKLFYSSVSALALRTAPTLIAMLAMHRWSFVRDLNIRRGTSKALSCRSEREPKLKSCLKHTHPLWNTSFVPVRARPFVLVSLVFGANFHLVCIRQSHLSCNIHRSVATQWHSCLCLFHR